VGDILKEPHHREYRMSTADNRYGLLVTCDPVGRVGGVCECRIHEHSDGSLCVDTAWPLLGSSNCLIVYDGSDVVIPCRVRRRSSSHSQENFQTYLDPIEGQKSIYDAATLRSLT